VGDYQKEGMRSVNRSTATILLTLQTLRDAAGSIAYPWPVRKASVSRELRGDAEIQARWHTEFLVRDANEVYPAAVRSPSRHRANHFYGFTGQTPANVESGSATSCPSTTSTPCPWRSPR
jgi:hypothetical protein